MKITKVEVKNFKSIKSYSVEIADFNIFVGPNNHGKTNFFDALDWYNSGKTQTSFYHKYDESLPITVRVSYKNVQKALSQIPNDEYRNAIKNAVGEFDEFVVEKTSEDDKRKIIVNGINKGNPRGLDSALNYFLPRIEYVNTKIRLGDVSAYKAKSPIAEMLSGVLEDIVEGDEKYNEFIRLFDEIFNSRDSNFRKAVNTLQDKVEFYLRKQFSADTSVNFKIADPQLQDMLKGFETEINDGVETRAEYKGDGMQRALMLSIIQAYADYRRMNGVVRNFVFLIDEAELHLHPSAQRALKKALRDIIENGGQVFINTHSPVFANEDFENQFIYSVQKSNGESQITIIKTPQDRLNSIYQLLGGSPNDILLPNNFILVEGQSEFNFLQTVISRFYAEDHKCCGIKVIFARGDIDKHRDIYHCIHECFLPLSTNGIYRDRVVFLLDKPKNDSKYQEFLKTHPWLIEGTNIHVLPVDAIEFYYPPPFTRDELSLKVLEEGQDKVNYATNVANNITFEQLQNEMPIVHQMLKEAIRLAYD